ncbi:MAG: hypothetical protein HC869_15695 [Rhodospirillales bacterium]|nr:hypothetical protein [Rhodospirillales bacterium]
MARKNMTAADYQQIRSPENRAGRHYSRFPPSRPCTINHLAGENADGVCRIGEVRLGLHAEPRRAPNQCSGLKVHHEVTKNTKKHEGSLISEASISLLRASLWSS